MARKPTYEELEERIGLLEDECDKIKKKEHRYRDLLKNSETLFERNMFKTISDDSNIGNAVFDLEGNFVYVNETFARLRGYTLEEVMNMRFSDLESGSERKDELHKQLVRDGSLRNAEVINVRKDGTTYPALLNATVIRDKEGRPQWIATSGIDISDRKNMEDTLREHEEELRIKNQSLEETNTALKILLDHREKDRTNLGNTVLENLKRLVTPFLTKLNQTRLDAQQKAYLEVIESNLRQVVSPFSETLTAKYRDLTPTEIRVANLIKDGKSAKEIAELLGVSKRTIDFHRGHLREKLSIKNKKANLRSHLLSLAKY